MVRQLVRPHAWSSASHGAGVRRRLAPAALIAACAACLVRHPPPDAPPATPTHETRRSYHSDGSTRSETRVVVWSDGRIERDGPEREFYPSGVLEAERFFDHGAPSRVWRTWFADGTPRSEVDFGAPGSAGTSVQRFWHASGLLAAEGTAVGGVREGAWTFWSENGAILRTGSYRRGKREGPWSFHDESGGRRAAGDYAEGKRVGTWTLWDEDGRAHVHPAAEVEPDDQ
jgi:antitoxin component YwqK of YwqJK toxin-antitoxin module